MEAKRRFREKTFNNNFNYLQNLYANLADGEWHTEWDVVRCRIPVNGILTTVTIKEALEIPSCAINLTLLERTTNWVERQAVSGKKMQVRWVGPVPTKKMMDELTVILDEQKNGKRNEEIRLAKEKERKEKETAVNDVPETVADVVEEGSATTGAEVILEHVERHSGTRTDAELKELIVEAIKEVFGDKIDKMYDVFCEIAGIPKD